MSNRSYCSYICGCRVNDRILSVNGVPLENVEYARAVQVLRDSGATVSLVVRRRAPAPPPTAPTTIKLSLARNGKKEGLYEMNILKV